MMKRSLSLTAGTLAIAWLPVTAVAADRPLEGRLESFLGKTELPIAAYLERIRPPSGLRSGSRRNGRGYLAAARARGRL